MATVPKWTMLEMVELGEALIPMQEMPSMAPLLPRAKKDLHFPHQGWHLEYPSCWGKIPQPQTCEFFPDCNDDQGWVDGWDNDTICWARGTSSNGAIITPQPHGSVGTCGGNFGTIHTTITTVFAMDQFITSPLESAPQHGLIFQELKKAA